MSGDLVRLILTEEKRGMGFSLKKFMKRITAWRNAKLMGLEVADSVNNLAGPAGRMTTSP
jgi:hypothetical protein